MSRLIRRFMVAATLLAGAALVAGCTLTRGDIPYAALETKYADVRTRFVDLPGGLHVRYRDQGPRTAPVLVMIHGFSASLEAWEPWVAPWRSNASAA